VSRVAAASGSLKDCIPSPEETTYALFRSDPAPQFPEDERRGGSGRADQLRKPLIITQDGEAKAVLQNVASYEETQEAMALLKILALGNQQIAQGKVKRVTDVVKRLRARRSVTNAIRSVIWQ
jgi:hypothetical protein